MNDKEIIKALECCDRTLRKGCCNCPLYEKESCITIMSNNALDLINRQKTEIERLREINNFLTEAGQEWQKRYEAAKSEACKEFADAATKRICEMVVAPIPSQSCIVESCNKEIYNTLKELTEVSDNEH